MRGKGLQGDDSWGLRIKRKGKLGMVVGEADGTLVVGG